MVICLHRRALIGKADMLLRCLSVRQPYTSVILTGQKVAEYRSQRTHHRGPLAIHASKTLAAQGFDVYPNFLRDRMATGAVLGIVEVVGCEEEADGGFAWILARPCWLTRPLPFKGRVGLLPVEVSSELLPARATRRKTHRTVTGRVAHLLRL